MPPTSPLPARMFNLEGTFLGFLGDNPRKPKSIILEVEQEQMAVKLPKELRVYARSAFKVGDRLRCVGSSQIDFKEGVIKLRAYQVFSLPPSATPAPDPAVPTMIKNEDIAALQRLLHNQSTTAPLSQKGAKILVCRKSGCQKRGGRKMVEALERILHTYQLQDQVEIRYTGCQKRCSKAPNLTVMPGKHYYENLNPRDLSALVEEHFCSLHSPHSEP